jgi:predicted Na+-dependent transporter
MTHTGEASQVDFLDVVFNLVYRVVVPLAAGQVRHLLCSAADAVTLTWARQIVHNCSPTLTAKFKKNKDVFKKIQEFSLVFIVFTVFSRTFAEGSNISVGNVIATICVQLVLLVLSMVS